MDDGGLYCDLLGIPHLFGYYPGNFAIVVRNDINRSLENRATKRTHAGAWEREGGRTVERPYSPIICTTRRRWRARLSKSTMMICWQVPSVSKPFAKGMIGDPC